MSSSPVYFLSAVWFRSDGGARRYQAHLEMAWPIAMKYGCKKLDSYVPETVMFGEFDADLIMFVRFPSREKFDACMNDPEFQEIFANRDKSLKKSFLVQCRRADYYYGHVLTGDVTLCRTLSP